MSLLAIADAANDLAELLERAAPKGLKHPRHAKHVKPARAAIKAVMVKFFERQRKAVLADIEPHIERQLMLHPRTNKESLTVAEAPQGGKTFARSLVPTSLHPLSFSATDAETSEYDDAITTLIGAAAKSLGAVDLGEDVVGRYLRENSLENLTDGLNDVSLTRLRDALADAWDKGGTYTDMVGAIKTTFDDFSETRADLIAQTESADAYNAGRRETALSLDFDEHAWETESGDPCPTCEANEAQGFIDIDSDFDSGDDAPTAHPNCLCVVNFRKSSEDKDEE